MAALSLSQYGKVSVWDFLVKTLLWVDKKLLLQIIIGYLDDYMVS